MGERKHPSDIYNIEAVSVFHFDDGNYNFEDFGRDNGFRYWYATDLAKCLGYKDFSAFHKGALNRAISVCASLNIPIEENFVQEKRDVNGQPILDHKLSRFACYLVAQNGDIKKPAVAQAQAFFAAVAASFQKYLEDANNIERLAIRDEISGKEKSLGSTAKAAGVTHYAFFQNAGYRGMYNMNLSKLKEVKKMPESGKCLMDYMGKSELAANLFRITQTEDKIKNENITGQTRLEDAAHSVGKTVRETMRKISGTKPENLVSDI